MEVYINKEGKMDPEVMKETKWSVFVKFLLTELDCLCFMLTWFIALYLALCRAVLYFICDTFRKSDSLEPLSSPGNNGGGPGNDDSKPKGDNKKEDLPLKMGDKSKLDSGLSSFDSSSTGVSPDGNELPSPTVQKGITTKQVGPILAARVPVPLRRDEDKDESARVEPVRHAVRVEPKDAEQLALETVVEIRQEIEKAKSGKNPGKIPRLQAELVTAERRWRNIQASARREQHKRRPSANL